MAGDFTVKIEGLPDLRAALQGIVPKLKKKVLQEALRAGARLVQREARRTAPVLKLSTYAGASASRRGVRAVGTVRKAITVRTSKRDTRQGDVGVFVNVRPLKRTSGKVRGAKNAADPFYWRWINFGWNPAGGDRSAAGKRTRRKLNKAGTAKIKVGAHFLEAGAAMLSQALAVFVKEIGPRIAKLNAGKNAQP
jgi:hypothetical protein